MDGLLGGDVRPVELRLGIVTGSRVRGGRVYVDADSPVTADFWTDLALLVLGGGRGRYRFAGVGSDAEAGTNPADTDASQVIVLITNEGRYAIQAVQHPKSTFKAAPPELEQAEDHPGDVSQQDLADVNGGTKVIVDGRGAVVVDVTGATDGNIRHQLPAGGVERISRDGKADERLAMVGPLASFLDDVTQHLSTQNSRITALEVAVETMSKAFTAAAGNTVLGVTVPFAAQGSQSPPSVVADELRAAALHISADNEVDS